LPLARFFIFFIFFYIFFFFFSFFFFSFIYLYFFLLSIIDTLSSFFGVRDVFSASMLNDTATDGREPSLAFVPLQ